MYVCICLCMCVCVFVCMYVCMYVCMCAWLCVCVYVCKYVCVYIHIYIYIYIYIYMCIYIYICLYIYIYICIYIYIYTELKVGCGSIVPCCVFRMRELLRPGEVCNFATAAREIAFDSAMPLVGAPAAGNAGSGDLNTIHMNALFDRPIP